MITLVLHNNLPVKLIQNVWIINKIIKCSTYFLKKWKVMIILSTNYYNYFINIHESLTKWYTS